MPLPLNITELIHGKTVEWERLEFKRGWNPADILHTLCAFANDIHNLGGGYILVGIAEEDGRPVLPPPGMAEKELDRIQKEVLRLTQNALQPAYHPIVCPEVIDGKAVLVIWAPGGEVRPYKAKVDLGKTSKDWGYYIRKQSSTVRARGQDETELLSLANRVPHDDRLHQAARVSDLSKPLIKEFLKSVGSDLADQADDLSIEELGRAMNIVGGPVEFPFPKNVGLMFFNEHPETFFPATQIDVVWFPDGRGGDQFVEKEFRGPLHRMLADALDYIKRRYIKDLVTKHPDRAPATRVQNFPVAAIEEALANAIYHRSYEDREPVEVQIERDEMIIISYPGPDRSVKLDELRRGRARPRRYRNRRIGDFLKELDITEGRGTGIPKILKAMASNGSPPPIFEFDEDHSYFMVRLPVHAEAAGVQVTSQAVPNDESFHKNLIDNCLTKLNTALSQLTPQLTPQVTPQVAMQVLKMIGALAERDCSREELQEISGITNRKHFRKTYAELLLAIEWIEYTIPDKPNSPLQRYRLTPAGAALISQLKQQ
jgi:ATP-dependent DNA helicase RecG